jgi:hypothetical protein
MDPVAAHVPVHLPHLAPCPYLPLPPQPLSAHCIAVLHHDRGPDFYVTAMQYGQSLWLQGYPARAVLVLNRALGCDLNGSEPVLARWPLPYQAMAWLLKHHLPGQFIGNPRVHWQHLATRMVEPRKEIRTWRAWACWRMACVLFPGMPGDERQIVREAVVEPGQVEISWNLERFGHPGEVALWQEALRFCEDGSA